MKISYPIRDKDGKEFRSLDEIMRLVDAEAHGTWLLGGGKDSTRILAQRKRHTVRSGRQIWSG